MRRFEAMLSAALDLTDDSVVVFSRVVHLASTILCALVKGVRWWLSMLGSLTSLYFV